MKYNVIIAIMLGVQVPGLLQGAQVQQKEILGRYFAKKVYTPAALPKYAEVKSELPSPIYDDNPLWVKTYWKAWELGFRHFHEPAPAERFCFSIHRRGFQPEHFPLGQLLHDHVLQLCLSPRAGNFDAG